MLFSCQISKWKLSFSYFGCGPNFFDQMFTDLFIRTYQTNLSLTVRNWAHRRFTIFNFFYTIFNSFMVPTKKFKSTKMVIFSYSFSIQFNAVMRLIKTIRHKWNVKEFSTKCRFEKVFLFFVNFEWECNKTKGIIESKSNESDFWV